MTKVTPIDEEYTFDEKVIITQTDKAGVITYANRMFCKVSGYTYDELVGQPHNILRHPDMPKKVFEKVLFNNHSTCKMEAFLSLLLLNGLLQRE